MHRDTLVHLCFCFLRLPNVSHKQYQTSKSLTIKSQAQAQQANRLSIHGTRTGTFTLTPQITYRSGARSRGLKASPGRHAPIAAWSRSASPAPASTVAARAEEHTSPSRHESNRTSAAWTPTPARARARTPAPRASGCRPTRRGPHLILRGGQWRVKENQASFKNWHGAANPFQPSGCT